MLRITLLMAWIALWLGACNESHAPRVEDSQTHWLRSCYSSSSCGGLDCICGVCVAPCTDNACNVEGRTTSCVTPGADALRGLCGTAAPEATALCLEPCGGGCAAGQQCVGGSCVAAQARSALRAGCTRRGKFYEIGEAMPSPDGCNTCRCSATGIDTCTLASCESNLPTSCRLHGKRYDIGSEMPAADNCNTCFCTVDGPDLCTQRNCSLTPPARGGCDVDGVHYDDGVSVPSAEGCNSCSCNDGTFGCTARACPLDAGAGCNIDAMHYEPGEPVPGQCGACSCNADGTLSCDPIACVDSAAQSDDGGVADAQSQPQDPGCTTLAPPQKEYADQQELEAALVGRWAPCMPSHQAGYGFRGEEAGVEFVSGGVWYGLSEVNGQIVRNAARGTWAFTPPDKFMIDALSTNAPFITSAPRSASIGVDPRFPRYVPLTR